MFVEKEKPTEDSQNTGAGPTVSLAVGLFPHHSQMTPECQPTFTSKQGFQHQQNSALGIKNLIEIK